MYEFLDTYRLLQTQDFFAARQGHRYRILIATYPLGINQVLLLQSLQQTLDYYELLYLFEAGQSLI